MKSRNPDAKQLTGIQKAAIAVAAATVVILLVLLFVFLLRADDATPEPATEPVPTAAAEEPLLELPCKIWDMEKLPDNLVEAGMAYANSNENIYGNVILGGADGKGVCGSRAFAYTFMGDYSDGDQFIMSPNSLKEAGPPKNWEGAEMLWFWVGGTELMQNVRLEIIINGRYMPKDSVYYTISEAGTCVEGGTIPIAWGSTTTRGRIRLEAGFEGWIGLPLSMYEYPEVITSLQFIVGNSTIKADNVLYLDDFWLTKMDQVPPLSEEERSYKTVDNLTLGQIWDCDEAQPGESVGSIGTDATRRNASARILEKKGVLGSNAAAYIVEAGNGKNTQNWNLQFNGLLKKGANLRGIQDPSDLLWFWVDSALSSDQLIHLQFNGVFMDDNKPIYTVEVKNGKPQLLEIPYCTSSGTVRGISAVPYNGVDGGRYARLELSKGWSGWVGIPVGNFCVNSDGTPAEVPNGVASRLTVRLFGDENSLVTGDALYFDEFWLTEAGQLPALSDEALKYGYTGISYRPMVSRGRIWNAEGLTEGYGVGTPAADSKRNAVAGKVADGKGVSGSKALAYTLKTAGNTNSNNLELDSSELENIGFKTGVPINGTDILWMWVDSAVSHDQLLHLQINGKLMDMTSVYIISEKDGKPVIREIPYTANAAEVSAGIGLVPANGKTADVDTTYSRIKLCDGWSGWIGIPVENFCINSNGTKAGGFVDRIQRYQIRTYVTNAQVLAPGDALYIDELWLTAAGTMPGLSDEQLLYGYTPYTQVELIDYGCIWNGDSLTEGTAIGLVSQDAGRNGVSSVLAADKGVSGTAALAYSLTTANKSNGNNVELVPGSLTEQGFRLARVTEADDILWLWVDSAAEYDQLLHIQVSSRLMTLGRSVYTISDQNGVPVITEVAYVKDGSLVTSGVGLVPSDGREEKETTTYERIKLCQGWSGWIGIPVENFMTNSDGTPADGTILMIDKLQLRNYVTNTGTLKTGDALYLDELWLTRAGTMPELPAEKLLYGYTAPVEEEEIPESRIWNVEHTDLSNEGMPLSGLVGGSADRNAATASVRFEMGVQGSRALAYQLDSAAKTQSNNLTLSGELLGKYGFRNAQIGAGTDILWFWVYSDLSADQLLHLQLNDTKKFMAAGQGLYTITADSSGTPVKTEVAWYGTSNAVPQGELGVVYPNGSTQGNYARIHVPAQFSGWIGVPVERFCVDAQGQTVASPSGTVTSVVLRLYGAANSLQRGDTLYLDEFCIVAGDALPELTPEALLYTYQPGLTTSLALSARYESGMIFQQGKPWQLHGTAAAGENVTVQLLDGTMPVRSATAQADQQGQWKVLLGAVEGAYKNYTLTVTCGAETKTLKDIVFGEVWVAGGQSNMFYTIAQTDDPMFNAQADVAALKQRLSANDKASYIRMYTQGTPVADFSGEQTEANGHWGNGSDWNSVLETSAVAMHYIEQLQGRLNMPVGVVVAARGGTAISTWVDMQVLESGSYQTFLELCKTLKYDTTNSAQYRLAGYFNSTVAPFRGYEAAGLLWYQGEQDRSNPDLQTYGLEVLAESWSKVFTTEPETAGLLDMIAIQIAPFVGYINSQNTYPDGDLMVNTNLNAAMRKGLQTIRQNGGNVVVVPIYDLSAIVDDHHPLNKRAVAERVYQAALETYYDGTAGNERYSGPEVTAVTYGADKITVTFDQSIRCIPLTREKNDRITKNGIYQLPDDSELWGDDLNGFSVYTGTGFVSAEARILGDNQVEVTVPDGVRAAGVSYAYGLEVLSANLYDMDGLAALPFLHKDPDWKDIRQTRLWSADEVAAQQINMNNARDGRNTSGISIAEGVGLKESQGLKFERITAGKQMTHTYNFNDPADYGFRTDVVTGADDDILWFWIHADLSVVETAQFEVNGTNISSAEGSYIYTIVNENGQPAMKKIEVGSTVNGMKLYEHSSKDKYCRIELQPGASGWIGIPMDQMKAPISAGSAITKLGVLLNQLGKDYSGQKVGDALIRDEYWLTSAGAMPDLSKDSLLYTVEEPAPAKALALMTLEKLTAGDLLEGITANSRSDDTTVVLYNASGNSTYDNSVFACVEDAGHNGLNALKLGVQSGKSLLYTCYGGLKLNIKAQEGVTVGSEALFEADAARTGVQADTVLWFYMDTTGLAVDAARLDVRVNWTQKKGPGYYYTIENGAVVQKALVSGETAHTVETAPADTNGAAIPLVKGFRGWLGVPLSDYTAATVLDINSVAFRLLNNGGNSGTKLTGSDSILISDLNIGAKSGSSWAVPDTNS